MLLSAHVDRVSLSQMRDTCCPKKRPRQTKGGLPYTDQDNGCQRGPSREVVPTSGRHPGPQSIVTDLYIGLKD